MRPQNSEARLVLKPAGFLHFRGLFCGVFPVYKKGAWRGKNNGASFLCTHWSAARTGGAAGVLWTDAKRALRAGAGRRGQADQRKDLAQAFCGGISVWKLPGQCADCADLVPQSYERRRGGGDLLSEGAGAGDRRTKWKSVGRMDNLLQSKPPKHGSWRSWLAQLPALEQKRLLGPLSLEALNALEHDWCFNARAEQWPPEGDCSVWLLLAGRGFGKTRTGAEWVRMQVQSGQARRIALVAPTAAYARDVMVEGESGLLAIQPDAQRPRFEPSKRRLTWPNGAMATTYSADEPERLRGPQHDSAWCDELAVWRYPQA